MAVSSTLCTDCKSGNEPAVDLDPVDDEALEIVERGIADAEAVDHRHTANHVGTPDG